MASGVGLPFIIASLWRAGCLAGLTEEMWQSGGIWIVSPALFLQAFGDDQPFGVIQVTL